MRSRLSVDAVLVWKLDRFARSLRHRMNALAQFRGTGRRLHQPARQPGPHDSGGSHDVPDNRLDGGVRAALNSGEGTGRVAERTREGGSAWLVRTFPSLWRKSNASAHRV